MTVLAGYAVLRFVCTLKEIEYVCNCAKVKGMYCQILYYLLIESEERLCQKMYVVGVKNATTTTYTFHTSIFASDS